MTQKIKYPVVVIMAITVAAVVFSLFVGKTDEADIKLNSTSIEKSDIQQKKEMKHDHDANDLMSNSSNSSARSDNSNSSENTEVMPRHEDLLTEEMKQAIRDKLLFHGPMEVIRNPDGSIELPSNGRFTQMPVAVEMPDGSIQIKEYSKLPK